MSKLSHLDESGAARMVDVSGKEATAREAAAEAVIRLSPDAYAAAVEGTGPKGDVLAAARIAGIMAAKKTAELIPLCHPLPLAKAAIDFERLAAGHALRIIAMVKTTAKTGVEMEALTAASIAALTIYDMIKAVDKGAVIETVRLLTKSGGKSGLYIAPHQKIVAGVPQRRPAAVKPGSRAKPAQLMSETGAVHRGDPNAAREAFRAFMAAHRLRATEWAKRAGVPAAHIYSFLTGKSRALNSETAEKLARAAHIAVDDLFRMRT